MKRWNSFFLSILYCGWNCVFGVNVSEQSICFWAFITSNLEFCFDSWKKVRLWKFGHQKIQCSAERRRVGIATQRSFEWNNTQIVCWTNFVCATRLENFNYHFSLRPLKWKKSISRRAYSFLSLKRVCHHV